MQHSTLRRAIAGAAILALCASSAAQAQFGLPGLPGPRINIPGGGGHHGPRLNPGVALVPIPGLYGRNGLGRTLGIIGTVAVGAVILQRLSVQDRREVTRRARVVVERDYDNRVVDTYRSRDGRSEVTVTAEPVRRASDFVDDPGLVKIADTKQQEQAQAQMPGQAQAPKQEPAQKQATQKTAKATTAEDRPDKDDVVRLAELPQDTNCRRVTTELSTKAQPAKGQAAPTTADTKETNVAIMCQTDKGWKPAGA